MIVTKTYYHHGVVADRPETGRGLTGFGLPRRRRFDERGEGVISAAIAVLIMAFIGVGMWVAFNTMFQQTAKNVSNQVNCIGKTSSSC